MDPTTLALGLLQNLAATGAARIWDRKRRGGKRFGEPRELNDRIRRFNRNIGRVLHEVLFASYSELEERALSLEIGGRRQSFPVVPLFHDARSNELGIEGALADEKDERMIDADLIDFLQRSGRRLYESDVYRLLAMTKDRQLFIGITTYYKALTSCDRFLFELIHRFPSKPSSFRLRVLSRSELLRRWRQDVAKVVERHQFGHLSAAIGISVLTIFRRRRRTGDDYLYLVIQNSVEKHHAVDRHVIPSFMYEPVTQSDLRAQAEEMELTFQVQREFGEELIGVKGLDRGHHHRQVILEMLAESPACRKLGELMADGGAELVPTGLWLDLFRLRPEISCALIIRDPSYYESYKKDFRGNWEQAFNSRWCRLASRTDFSELLMDSEVPMCPPGVGALVAGREYALRRLGVTEEA